MKKAVLILNAGALVLVLNSAVIAQEQELKPVEEPLDLTQKGYQDAQTGLQVEERRYDNRLDGVTVQRQNGNVQDYYNLADPDVERRDGGILESGAMRTWRFGGGR